MDYAEEQSNEIVVLQSVYYDEYEEITDTPFHDFKMTIKYKEYEDREPMSDPPSITIRFQYTPKYPEELPVIELDSSENLPNRKVEELMEEIIKVGHEALGTVMVYNMICAAQEWINNYADKLNEADKTSAEEKRKEEEELESKKIEGTLVTIESFLKWKKMFDVEMEEKSKEDVEKEKRPTGRELFTKDTTLNESDLQFLEDEEAVAVDESLFNGEQFDAKHKNDVEDDSDDSDFNIDGIILSSEDDLDLDYE